LSRGLHEAPALGRGHVPTVGDGAHRGATAVTAGQDDLREDPAADLRGQQAARGCAAPGHAGAAQAAAARQAAVQLTANLVQLAW